MTARRLLVGLTCVWVLAELGFRSSGPLPSLRADLRPFEASDYPSVKAIGPEPAGCVEVDIGQAPPTAWRRVSGEGAGEPLKILIVGDSVALGRGVSPRDTWAVGLGDRLAEATDSRVEVVNAAVNASGYCGVFRALHHHVVHEDFDRIVVGLFADDLEQRAVVLEDGAVYANPEALPGLVGALASHSHVFNALWLEVLKVAVAREPDEIPSSILGPGRSVPHEVLDNLRESISLVAKYKPIFLLNSPAGMGYCSSGSPPRDCDWLRVDMAHLAQALDESGEEWIDNRSLFDQETTRTTLSVEQDWLRKVNRLPVHPNREGHRMIAETVPEAWLISPASRESDG